MAPHSKKVGRRTKMRYRAAHRRRSAATMVELAIVMVTLITFIGGIVIMGIGVFNYQQLATLAREGARYASLHGTDYASATGNKAATADDVYNNAIKPLAIGLDLDPKLVTVTWNTSNTPTRTNKSGTVIANTVTVTVTYVWHPVFFADITMTSSSVMPMVF
jgi:Flp pilus assembly protein TadG